MTPEERLDRLERIARLMVRAGLRARRQMRERAEKIDILIDSQIKNEDRFTTLAQSQSAAAARVDRLARAVEKLIAQGHDGETTQTRGEQGDRRRQLNSAGRSTYLRP